MLKGKARLRPNVLALNFASTVVQSMVFLVIFMVLSSALLFKFYFLSRNCERYRRSEGLQPADPEGKQWGLVVTTFLLTVIYLPLSTMAVHVLVWSDDLWVVSNPYTNATSFPPVVPPLGPSSEYRDPLDFCWTTTMKKNEVRITSLHVTTGLTFRLKINFAPAIVILALVAVLSVFMSLKSDFTRC